MSLSSSSSASDQQDLDKEDLQVMRTITQFNLDTIQNKIE